MLQDRADHGQRVKQGRPNVFRLEGKAGDWRRRRRQARPWTGGDGGWADDYSRSGRGLEMMRTWVSSVGIGKPE